MRIARNLLLAVLALAALAALGAFALYWDTTRGPLPQTVGALDAVGLEAQVEVLRDEWGVPHIYAFTPNDLFFAQGYVQAQDRWWQMEFSRHVGKGTLGELVGMTGSTFAADVFVRTAGWRQAAERDAALLNEAARAQLSAFARGVNAYISSRAADDLALEYRLLGLTGNTIAVEPWTVIDTLAWGKAMAWLLSSSYDRELRLQTLIAELGEDMARAFLPAYPYDLANAPTIVSLSDLPLADATTANPTLIAPMTNRAYSLNMAGGIAPDDVIAGVVRATRPEGTGSNNWAVTDSMSSTGLAMIAGDIHLEPSIPSNLYVVGLHCLPVRDACPYDLIGYTFPPVPGIFMGHNADIAWTMTTTGTDAQDLYILEWNPDDPLQYRWNGEWRSATVREEIIDFADGSAPVTLRVRETHIGPVFNDNTIDATTQTLAGFNTVDPLVLRWTGHDGGTTANALLAWASAKDWEEFRAGAAEFTFAAHNLVFADVRGNIGYQLPGITPIRPAGRTGELPQTASSDADLWLGSIPFDDLPRILNPERDYVFSANQAVAPLAYYDQLGIEGNALISTSWANGERAGRIETLLKEQAPHSLDTFAYMQGDVYDIYSSRLLPYFANLSIDDANLYQARDFMTSWDGNFTTSSGQAALFAQVSRAMLARLFDDQLPGDYRADTRQLFSAWLLMEQPNSPWWDDVTTTEKIETRDELLYLALLDGVRAQTAAQGNNPADWNWGNLRQTVYINNPLGLSGIGLLEQMVNRTVPISAGSTTTLNATEWTASSGNFNVTQHPAQRLLIDMSDFDATRSVLPNGQSGHPFSPHYDDMASLYREGRTMMLLFSRPAVESATKERLVLSPPGVD